jgi:RNA polymerase primary sigma factor
LSRSEEVELAVRAREGDLRAREKLVRHNLAFVAMVVRRQGRRGARLEDLIQEGNVGLLRAVERFDPRVGTRFSTYAIWWIRAYVGKYLKEAPSAVRPPSGCAAQSDLSLDGACEEDGATPTVEQIEDSGPSPEALYLSAEVERLLRAALARVRKRIGELGWDIIHSRLAQDEPKTLEEVGRPRGVSRECVRKAELRTKQFLARHLRDAEIGEPGRSAA